MKKIITYLFIVGLCFTLTGCGESEKTYGGDGSTETCEKVETTDKFYEIYSYGEKFMQPDDGIVTSVRDFGGEDNKHFLMVVECITEKGMDNYDEKLIDLGFERNWLTYTKKDTDQKISLSNHTADANILYIYIYPSIATAD